MADRPEQHESQSWLKTTVLNWFWRFALSCREVTRLTSEELDHALPLGKRLRVRLHRCFCAWCSRYEKQLHLVREASHRFPEHLDATPDNGLKSDARQRLKCALRGEAEK